jgi:hypothetical protein
VKELASEIVVVFEAQKVHREALATLLTSPAGRDAGDGGLSRPGKSPAFWSGGARLPGSEKIFADPLDNAMHIGSPYAHLTCQLRRVRVPGPEGPRNE